MQTFLPYPDFVRSAACLDKKRLGKQRVEVLTMLRALLGRPNRWISHPATKMWKGYERALALYGRTICEEWKARGGKDSCGVQIEALVSDLISEQMPPWLGNEAFHASHRAALLLKKPDWYGKFGWTEEPKKQYYWPV